MNTPMMWFLLANIGFAVLWCFYRIFLHRDTFFTGKRLTLLLGLIFSLVYPLFNIAAWIPILKPVQHLTQSISVSLPVITVTAYGKDAYSTMEMLTMLYLIIMGLLIIRVMYQFAKLILLSFRNRSLVVEGQKIICLPKGSAPFSFFGLVFIQPEDHSESDLNEILHHERTHIRQAHTFDVIFSELICTIFWINPFTWLLKYDLRENLEFLADKDVVHAGFDPKSYQYHLLRLSYQQSPIRMGNNFNVSQLQNRIKMMNKKRTSQVGWGKYLLTLPLFAALLMVSYACKNKTEKDTNAEITVESIAIDSTVAIDTTVATPPPLKSTVKFVAPKIEKSIKTTIKFTAPVITKENKPVEAIAHVYKSPDVTVIVTDLLTDSSKVVKVADEMPKYPGGMPALIKFISDNLHYPEVAKNAGIEGRVNIQFIVTKTGDIAKATIMRSLDPSCDKEALRVLKAMPKWEPGKDNGLPVDVIFILPITFKLKQ